jgi:Ni,Fe-hydrogenase III large subunit/Ni,Fe-hydrogenase III component G
MSKITAVLAEIYQTPPLQLPRRAENEIHLVVENAEDLVSLSRWAKEKNYYLCTLVANDERLLEGNAFKLYYVFSAPDGEFLICEHPLSRHQPRQFGSIYEIFPAVIPLEREIRDLFGISSEELPADPNGFVLHNPYPANLHPLRRTRPQTTLDNRQQELPPKTVVPPPRQPEGVMILPVGPIHAGIIEPGHFPFHVAGEVIEDVPLRLGYKHRGIEKMMETKYTLVTGWQLAEKVSGDSSFAHSLAYCQAVESLADITVPITAVLWRTVFLELERIYNHIADVSALMHDISLDVVASELSLLREAVVQLNKRLTGSRLLRGVNRPGGIDLSRTPDIDDIRVILTAITDRFMQLGNLVLEMQHCRDRAIGTGILTRTEADQIGATGLVARASGNMQHDFRIRHPNEVYNRPFIQALISQTITRDVEMTDHQTPRRTIVYDTDLKGDVFARMALRIAEVETAVAVILSLLKELGENISEPLIDKGGEAALGQVPNYEFSLGYVEGWRGDICYWLMKGPGNAIYRCKVRDPSLFNWPALRLATIRKPNENQQEKFLENILADFPLINKSFNLSYAGHDL